MAAASEGTQLCLHDQGLSQQEDAEPQIGGRVQQELQHWDLHQAAQLGERKESRALRVLFKSLPTLDNFRDAQPPHVSSSHSLTYSDIYEECTVN